MNKRDKYDFLAILYNIMILAFAKGKAYLYSRKFVVQL